MRPTKPADSDSIIWELHDQGSDQVTRWLLSGGLGFTPKYCRTKKDVDKAKREAISHAKINKVDVWIGDTTRFYAAGRPIDEPSNTEKPSDARRADP